MLGKYNFTRFTKALQIFSEFESQSAERLLDNGDIERYLVDSFVQHRDIQEALKIWFGELKSVVDTQDRLEKLRVFLLSAADRMNHPLVNHTIPEAFAQAVVALLSYSQSNDVLFGVAGDRIQAFDFGVNGSSPHDLGTHVFAGRVLSLQMDDHGRAAWRYHVSQGNVWNYLTAIFQRTNAAGLMAEVAFSLDPEKMFRFVQALDKDFIQRESIESRQAARDSAGKTRDVVQVSPGGIDARKVSVERQGTLTADVLSEGAMEAVLNNALGLRGVILSITPMTSLPALLGVTSSPLSTAK